MRERGISTLGGVLLAALAGMLAATVMADWMVVDIHTPEPEAFHLWVPFPLVAGRLASGFIPEDALEEAVLPPEVRANREPVLAALRELDAAPDATLVKVDANDARVEIRKEGHDLLISVDADDAKVRCTVPLDGILEALEDWDWERVDPGMAFDILSAIGHGDLVNVEADDGTRVAVKIW